MFHHMECEKKYCFCYYKKEDFFSPLSTDYHPTVPVTRPDTSIFNFPSHFRNLALKYPTFPASSIMPSRCETSHIIILDSYYPSHEINTDC